MKAPDVPQVAQATPSAAGIGGGSEIRPVTETAGEQAVELGGAVASLGQAAVRLGQSMQRDVDEAAINGADAAMAEHLHNLLDTADGGYMHAIGKDAVDRRVEVEQDLIRIRDRVMGDLTPSQAKRYRKVADARVERALGRVNNRAADQGRAYVIGESTSRLQTLVADAYKLGVSGDEEGASVALGTAKRQARRLAELQGYGPEQTEELVRKTTSAAHSMTIAALIDRGQTDRAGELLSQAMDADEIDPAAAQELGVANRRASAGRWGRELADSYFQQIATEMSDEAAKATGLGERRPWMRLATPGVELAPADEAMAELDWQAEGWSRFQARLDKQLERGDFTEDIYRSALSAGREKFDQHQKQEAARYDAATTSAERFLLENKWASLGDLETTLPTVYAQIERTPGGLARMAQFAQSRRYVTDPQKLLAFDAVPDTDLARLNEAELRVWMRGETDDSDWGYVQARWKKVRGEAGKDDDWLLKSKDYVEEAAKRAKVIPREGRWSDSQEERWFIFRQNAQKRFNEERDRLKANGKEFAPEDAERLMDELALDIVQLNVAWATDPKVPASALLPARAPTMQDREGRKDEFVKAYVMVPGHADPIYLRDMLNAGPEGNKPVVKIAAHLKRFGQRATWSDVANIWVGLGKPLTIDPEMQKWLDSPAVPLTERQKIVEALEGEGRRYNEYTIWRAWQDAGAPK